MATVMNDITSLRAFLNDHIEHRPTVPHGPGLGLGGRMGKLASTSAMLAIRKLNIEASAIQASVFRELRPEFVDAKNTHVDYKGIGKVPVGHTGMTIREQFLDAVRDRIRREITTSYVADADHIPLFGDSPEDIKKFSQFVEEAQDRTLFTIDPHFCIDESFTSPKEKFRLSINALEKAGKVIAQIKNSPNYAIEVSIDECVGLTSLEDMVFLVDTIVRKKIPVFSIAPAIGFTKKDEDDPKLLYHFKNVLPDFNRIVRAHGMVLGIHSGDGKGEKTLRVIGELTEGNIWYKVSPDRQRIFLKLLSESPEGSQERKLFIDIFQFLKQIVEEGVKSHDADFADNCRRSLKELNNRSFSKPSDRCHMIYDFGFLAVRPFQKRIAGLDERFSERYYVADFEYIRNLAENLGLVR